MNSFDIAVYLGLIIAVVTGFNTGLLRSALTILAYLFAMPIALWVMSVISPRLDAGSTSPLSQSWPLFFGIFLVSGMALGKLARMALDEAIGNEAGVADRLGGRRTRRGPRRSGRHDLCADFRPAAAGQPPACIPQRLAIAADVLGGRPDGFSLAAAGCRGHHRSPEERAAHLGRARRHGIVTIPLMHFCGARSLIRAVEVG
jgi:hypothetical protein